MTRRNAGPVRLPPAGRGQRIGLYGGSFDPPHAGHRHVAATALRRLGLDAVWVLVSPGNPLKDRSRLGGLPARIAAAKLTFRHPRMRVSDLETQLGLVFTVETVRALLRQRPDLHFVWIMGGDSWAGFHRWRGWRTIASLLPLAIVDRPGWILSGAAGQAAQALRPFGRPEREALRLADQGAPAWIVLHGRRSRLSSTSLRAAGSFVDGRH